MDGSGNAFNAFLKGLLRVIGRRLQEHTWLMEEDLVTSQIFLSVTRPLTSVRECLRLHKVADRRAVPRTAPTRRWTGRQTRLA
jgi:hypothetical protein